MVSPRAKLNALADSTVIHGLYRASQAGVDVDLIVRGTTQLADPEAWRLEGDGRYDRL